MLPMLDIMALQHYIPLLLKVCSEWDVDWDAPLSKKNILRSTQHSIFEITLFEFGRVISYIVEKKDFFA